MVKLYTFFSLVFHRYKNLGNFFFSQGVGLNGKKIDCLRLRVNLRIICFSSTLCISVRRDTSVRSQIFSFKCNPLQNVSRDLLSLQIPPDNEIPLPRLFLTPSLTLTLFLYTHCLPSSVFRWTWFFLHSRTRSSREVSVR